MAQVAITIRGRSYTIACEDGQEAHLARLGRFLDQRAEQLLKSTGPVSDTMLLVMVGLLISDELSDKVGELEALLGAGEARAAAEDEIVTAVDALTGRIEQLAERLENT